MDRIAKLIARAGVCSRRDAEKLILAGRVTFQNKIIDNPALKFENTDEIKIDGKNIKTNKTKLWLYHKPIGIVVTHKDEQGRETMFDQLKIRERVISIGRLDKNTSGLILLTNDGDLARKYEHPSSNLERTYLVRVFGEVDFSNIKKILEKPININNETFKPIDASIETRGKYNNWLKLVLREGKNREIRKIINFLGLNISRLIRVKYGPYELGDLKPGQFKEASIC